MRKSFLFLYFFFYSVQVFSYLQMYNPLDENAKLIKLGYRSSYHLGEYERSEVPIDSIQLRGNVVDVEYSWRKESLFEYKLELSYLFSGDFKETYNGELSFIPTNEEDSNGFKEPLFGIRRWFRHNFSKNFRHAIELDYRPKLFEPDISSYAEGRHILTARYLFSHYENNFEIAGNIYSRLYGKRELELRDDLNDETQAYSEVGFIIEPGLILERNSFHISLGYFSTTDYNTSNSLYQRESDKGFIWQYGFNYKYKIDKKNFIELRSGWRFTTFNSIEESRNADVEFKIEERDFSLKWWRFF